MPFPDSQYPSVLRGYDKRQSERLLNAAPDLLYELKRLLGLWEEAIGWEKDYMDMADSARKAIAKAEGQ
jgi:hypothetical protein